MRKTIAILIMVFVVLTYYNSLQKRLPDSKKKKETIDVIMDIKEHLEDDYPDNPAHIVEVNNVIIDILYGKPLTDEEKSLAIDTQRLLYSSEFLEINPVEKQMLELERERIMNDENDIKVIGSKVMNSYNDPPGTMHIQVIHYTNKQDQDLVREYIVKEEVQDGQNKEWKIFGWKNTGRVKTQEEEE